MPYLIC